MATIICLAAARHRAFEADGWDVRAEGLTGASRPVLYASAEGHSCLGKAAELLGIGTRGVRVIPVDREFRMDPAALRAEVARDLGEGLQPLCVVANAGTVNTGAVDHMDELADISAAHGIWLHVDGAYGALGVLDPAAGSRYSGMARADSLALDPHKWLGVRVDCGAILVRDPARLRDTFSLAPRICGTKTPMASAASPSTGSSRPDHHAPCGPGPPPPTAAERGSPAWSGTPPRLPEPSPR